MTNILLKSQKKKYYIFLIIIIILIFIPIKIPFNISSKGKMLSQKQYLLIKGTDGKLISILKNNLAGSTESFSVTQFERGDLIQFFMNDKILAGNFIHENDTIAYILSNLSESELIRLKAELANEIAMLKLSSSKEKESIINTENQKLEFAQKQFEEQSKIFNRQKSLFEKQLISQEEYELAKSSLELYKINVDIARERLKTVMTGSKPEEVELIKTKIEGLQNQIRILEKKFMKYYLQSPIDGIVRRTFSQDTLLEVDDIQSMLVFIPLSTNDVNFVKKDMQVKIYSKLTGKKFFGKILNIEKTNITGYVSPIIYALVKIKNNNLIYDEENNIDVDIMVDEVYPLEFLWIIIKNIFSVK